MWLSGTMVVSKTITDRNKPYGSLLVLDFTNKAVKREFTTKWMMELYPGFVLTTQFDEVYVHLTMQLQLSI